MRNESKTWVQTFTVKISYPFNEILDVFHIFMSSGWYFHGNLTTIFYKRRLIGSKCYRKWRSFRYNTSQLTCYFALLTTMNVNYIIYHVHTLCNIESIFLLIILYDIMFEFHIESTNTQIAVDHAWTGTFSPEITLVIRNLHWQSH